MEMWKDLIETWRSREGDEYGIIYQEPASLKSLESIENFLNYNLPREFLELYSAFDGMGLKRGGEIYWCFVPTDKLPTFTVEVRDWFSETHPELSRNYFPFFDWLDGDAVGYLNVESDGMRGSLYEFSHEQYEFDENQPWQDFLVRLEETSIKAFLINLGREYESS